MGSPGSYLSSREEACFHNCARGFLATTQFIVQVRCSSLTMRTTWPRLPMCKCADLMVVDRCIDSVQRFESKANSGGL